MIVLIHYPGHYSDCPCYLFNVFNENSNYMKELEIKQLMPYSVLLVVCAVVKVVSSHLDINHQANELTRLKWKHKWESILKQQLNWQHIVVYWQCVCVCVYMHIYTHITTKIALCSSSSSSSKVNADK